jgi:pilus assembly protein TadC
MAMGFIDVRLTVNFIIREIKNPRHFAGTFGAILVLVGIVLGLLGQPLWGFASFTVGALTVFAVLDPQLFREFVRWCMRGIAKGLGDIW